MEIANLWPEKVDNALIILLEKYIERRSCNCRSGSSLPKEATRHVTRIFRNKQDQRCFMIETITGVEEGRSTAPKFHTRVDEFGYAFRSLTDKEQILILGHADPFDELTNKEEFKKFLKEQGIGKEQEYYKLLEAAFLKLQNICAMRGLVTVTEDILSTWAEIAAFLEVSIPTAKKMTVENNLPISFLNGRVISSKTKIEKRLNEIIEEANYNKGRNK